MCGIFGYANYLTKRTKREIADILVNGLRRIEYRGYDSAGMCIQGKNARNFVLHRSVGKVEKLAEYLDKIPLSDEIESHVGIAHTRWATHGQPCERNTHPMRSDLNSTFVCVHNGIITNYKELRSFLESQKFIFESETDTECAAKLAHLFYNEMLSNKEKPDFVKIVKRVAANCDGAFAFVFMSTKFPNEMVAVRKSSPLLLGIRTSSQVTLDFFDVNFSAPEERSIVTSCVLDKNEKFNFTSAGDASGSAQENSILNVPPVHEKYKQSQPNNVLGLNKIASPDLAPMIPGTLRSPELRATEISLNLNTLSLSPNNMVNNLLSPHSSPGNLQSLDSFNLRNTDNSNQMEIFLASDASAIIEHTKKVIYLEDDDIAHIADGNLNIHRPNTRENDTLKIPTREVKTVETEISQIMKGNYEHFMLKEIYEQPDSVFNTMRGRVDFENSKIRLGGLLQYARTIKKSQRLLFVACGTSYHSCLATRSLFEELVDIPTQIEISSDFIDRKALVTRGDCVFFVSQSGETADTILALRHCQERGALCVGITNTVGSTISRETSCGVHINAGPEIGVASTKAYTSQYVSLAMIALMLSQDNSAHDSRRKKIIEGLKGVSELIAETLKLDVVIKKLAEASLKKEKYILILGRGYQHATCLEGALKIKELTYIPTEGILSGELKHGPIALIEENVRVIFVIANDGERLKANSAVQQVVARHGKPLIFCTNELVKDYPGLQCIGFPSTVDCLQGLVSVIPMQLIAYHIASSKGYDVDCPRNLAKSVTVE